MALLGLGATEVEEKEKGRQRGKWLVDGWVGRLRRRKMKVEGVQGVGWGSQVVGCWWHSLTGPRPQRLAVPLCSVLHLVERDLLLAPLKKPHKISSFGSAQVAGMSDVTGETEHKPKPWGPEEIMVVAISLKSLQLLSEYLASCHCNNRNGDTDPFGHLYVFGVSYHSDVKRVTFMTLNH